MRPVIKKVLVWVLVGLILTGCNVLAPLPTPVSTATIRPATVTPTALVPTPTQPAATLTPGNPVQVNTLLGEIKDTPIPTVIVPPLTHSLPPSGNSLFSLQSQAGGSVAGVALLGNTAYVGIGPRLAAVDVSNPSAPRLLAQSPVLAGVVSGVLLFSSSPAPRLVASAGRYVTILTTSASGEISVAGEIALPGDIETMILNGSNGKLYAGGSIYQSYDQNSGEVTLGFVDVVDVSGSSDPRLLDHIDLSDDVWSLALGKTMLYAGLFQQGIMGIPLLSNDQLGQPVIAIPASDIYQAAYSMQVRGDRLYVGTNQALIAYDISNPAAPEEKWHVGGDGSSYQALPLFEVRGFVLHENRIDAAGVVALEGTFFPLGITTITPPEPVTGTSDAVPASMVASTQDRLFLANDGLEIYSYSNQPLNLKKLGVYFPDLAVVSYQVAVGDYLYTIDENSGGETPQYLHVMRMSDLAVVGELRLDVPEGYSFTIGWCRGMVQEGNRLYLFGRLGTWIFDISNPAKPSLLGRPLALNDWADAGAAASPGTRHLLFLFRGLPTGSYILTAYDASDVDHIKELSSVSIEENDQVSRMVWSGNTLYAVTEQRMFYVISLENGELKVQSKTKLEGYFTAIAVQKDLVALAGTQGLVILSIADAAQPQIISQTPLPGSGVAVTFKDNRLITIVNGRLLSQLLAFDVSDPHLPRLVTTADVPLTDCFSNAGSYIVLSGTLSGIEVLKEF